MNDILNEEQLRVLQHEAKDVIARFLKATENEPVNQDVNAPTAGFKKAYEEIIMPLARKYPGYFRWIARAIADARDGKQPLAPVHNSYVWVNKATEKQQLKVMLLHGTKTQVFSAAKEIGMVSHDLPETDENLAKLRGVLSLLNDIWGSV
jgi:hypothetical protein